MKIEDAANTLEWYINNEMGGSEKETCLAALRALLEGYEAAVNGVWISVEEHTPIEGEVVEIVSIPEVDRARYTPSDNPFFPWSLIDWPTPETEEGTFFRGREVVTHWRRGPEPGGEGTSHD